MKKFLSHGITLIASIVFVGIIASVEQKMVGFSTLAAFLLGKFGYDPLQKVLDKKIK